MKTFGIFILAIWFGLFGYQEAYPKMFKAALLDGPKVQLTANAMVDAAGKPLRNPDGSYPLLLASMKSGQVTEITPTNVAKWGETVSKKIKGKDYWVILVTFRTRTYFGSPFMEANAYVHDAKVEKWLYNNDLDLVVP